MKREMEHTHTDCRSETGITVGLIDSIITISRVLKIRLSQQDISRLPKEILSAFNDFETDNDIKFIADIAKKSNNKYLKDLRKEQSKWNEYPDM